MRARTIAIALLGAALWSAGGHPAAAAGVEARLERSRIVAGESATLEVVVSGAGNLGEPEFQVPEGVEVLGTARAQNFSWVNGKSSAQTVFRYELGAAAPGTYTLGPIRIRAGNEIYSSAALTLEVVANAPNLGGSGRGGAVGREGPARLEVEATPRDPWVGQPVILRVRLIQRQALAEDPRYGPPSTTGFWAEPPSRPSSFYAVEGDQRVLVTETRARLYPLAAGLATVGSAIAELTLAAGNAFDPFPWPGGGRRRVQVHSEPVQVRVRALPRGAPPGFDGAVGSFDLAWSADRASTSQDVALTVRLEVRGIGNLPMVHTPELRGDDWDVFAGPVDDSLGTPGTEGAARRSFRWTVLPRRAGTIEIPAPPFAWFDPAAGAYRRTQLASLVIEVGPPLGPAGTGRETFPLVFADHPIGTPVRPPRVWAWALGGLLVGASLALWRAGARGPAEAADRARQREWLRAARLSGPDFWRAAEEAALWLEARGRPVAELRRDIAAARYAIGFADPEPFRARLIEALTFGLSGPRRGFPLRALAILAALAGLAVAGAGGPRWGSGRGALEAQAADAKARSGDVEGARRSWLALWSSGGRAPGIGARLAWTELRAGSTAEATLWALRAERGEPRDAALRWVWERVRESGGLTGASSTRLPVRTSEWAVAAFLLGVLGGALWPRRRRSMIAAALALACAAVGPFETWRAVHRGEAVVRSAVPLEGAGGTGLDLPPGQVVRLRAREGDRVRVSAGRDVAGWVPASRIAEVD